jgi:hypothetical protein
MKIYIFGAGASLGSQDKKTLAPKEKSPLVDQIFDAVYEEYADALYIDRSILRNIKTQIGEAPLEKWLTDEWHRIHAPHGKETLSAGLKRFGNLSLYTWWLMTNISKTYDYTNGYHYFLQKLDEIDDKEEKAFVNFNYDILLDKAFEKVLGYDLSSSISNYTTHNYLKPHGSVNWFVKMRSSAVQITKQDTFHKEIVFSRITGEMFNGQPIDKNLLIIDPLNPNLYSLNKFFINTFNEGQYGFPLVLLPLSSKMNDLIVGFMDTIKAEVPRIFSEASNIYIIGYQGRDELINDMLSHVPANTKLHVVGKSNASEIQKYLLTLSNNLIPGDVFTGGFYSFIDKIN